MNQIVQNLKKMPRNLGAVIPILGFFGQGTLTTKSGIVLQSKVSEMFLFDILFDD